jgi:hypothetical protein
MKIRTLFGSVVMILIFTVFANAQDPGAPPDPASADQPKLSAPARIRVGSNVQVAKILHQVMPVYPPIAKTAHITGTILLHAIIAKDGSVKDLTYVSGPPLLMKSAMDAVKQWVYQPTLLNGSPVEVDTTISVIFTLGGAGNPPSEGSSSAVTAKAIDPQLKEDILQLMQITHMKDTATEGARSVMKGIRPTIVQSLPNTPKREEIADAYLEKLVALFDTKSFTNGVIAVYAKYFSDDDVKALTQFYQTPAGQRLNAALPKLMGEMEGVGRQLATDNMAGIWRDLCNSYPELKGKTSVCPADSEKNSLLLDPRVPNGEVVSVA